MHSHKTSTIVTSPTLNFLPSTGGSASPTTNRAPVYRVEEQSRIIYEDAIDSSDEARVQSPRKGIFRSRRPGIKSVSGVPNSRTTVTFLGILQGSPPLPTTRQRVLFYHKHDPYYGFTNFSPHPVIYKGKQYPTSEHLFQAFKFQNHHPNLAEHIRTCSERPSVALSEAHRFQPEVRSDWKQVNIEKMDETLFYKFTQHPNLRAELLGTGDAELIENSDKDTFWGVGSDRKGRNELGKCLERLRTKLRGKGWS